MSKFEVILNKWVGKSFENETTCDLCGNPGHVAVVPLRIQMPPNILLDLFPGDKTADVRLKICQGCSHSMTTSIYGAIMESIPKWRDPKDVPALHGSPGAHGSS